METTVKQDLSSDKDLIAFLLSVKHAYLLSRCMLHKVWIKENWEMELFIWNDHNSQSVKTYHSYVAQHPWKQSPNIQTQSVID